jgi:hypothetical protein
VVVSGSAGLIAEEEILCWAGFGLARRQGLVYYLILDYRLVEGWCLILEKLMLLLSAYHTERILCCAQGYDKLYRAFPALERSKPGQAPRELFLRQPLGKMLKGGSSK